MVTEQHSRLAERLAHEECDRCGAPVAMMFVFAGRDRDLVLMLCAEHTIRSSKALRKQADSCYAAAGKVLW